jgi:hypothetical protein
MITLRHAELFRCDLRARMPFRYGIATMTEVPQVILRLTFEIDGATHTGFAADNLPPKWFTKDPKRLLDDEVAEMLRVIRAAVAHARGIRAATPFAFWRELYDAQAAWAAAEKLPPLLSNFGTSFVERALIHAVCRARGATLASALRENLLGIDLGALQPSLAGSAPRDWLPASPPTAVFARHTVGLSDPMRPDEIAADERVADGLPQSLDACIRFYGLRHFKIKINGEAARDRDRLARMAAVFAAECGDDFAFSLDGNESFHDVASFADYYRGLVATPELRSLWPHLLYVEQPWHRSVALSPAIGDLARAWPDRPPIIIDESDAELSSLPTALTLGYAGTSHKNCKGVFKSVVNASLLARRRAAGQPAVLSGEDLANVGPVGLLQDLAAQAVLGVTSVERNGHHYFAGLAQFPTALQAHALAHHGDLFIEHSDDATGKTWPRLDVRAGKLALGSVLRASFGVADDPDLTGMVSTEIA